MRGTTRCLESWGGDDFEVEHTGTRKRQREGTLAKLVEADREASKAGLDWWVDGVELIGDPVF